MIISTWLNDVGAAPLPILQGINPGTSHWSHGFVWKSVMPKFWVCVHCFLFKIAILGGIPVICICFQTHPDIFQIQSAGLTVHQQYGKKRAACHRFCSPIHIEVAAIPIHIAQILLACCSYPPVCSFKTSIFDDVRWLLYPPAIRKLSMSIDVYRLRLRPGASKHLRRSIHMAGLNLRWPSGLAQAAVYTVCECHRDSRCLYM